MEKPLYLPFVDRRHLAMGLKPLALADWIEVDREMPEQLALKAQLLGDRPSEVFVSLPESRAAQQEVLDLLVSHLLHYFPAIYRRTTAGLENRLTGETWQLADYAENPLDLAGRLVQEDLCLLLPEAYQENYRLAAASVCFPSRWQLRPKLGQPIAQIHDPVPGYAQKLERPVDRFLDRLQPDYPGYRLNWSILDTPDLFLNGLSGTTPQTSSPITPENAGDRLWLRVERQTLRRLPLSNGILFTIRTYVYPLHQAIGDAAVARSLHQALQQLPPAMQIYKTLTPIQPVLLEYLAGIGDRFNGHESNVISKKAQGF